MKVLIADDSLVMRRLLQATLEGWGYDVAVAADGAEAWEVLKGSGAPVIAILDWIMPIFTGPELCRLVRRQKTSAYTYLILLTSKSQREDIVEGMDAGADDYVVKPFSPRELLARIKAVPQRSRALPQRVGESGNTLVFDGWQLDLTRREVHTPDGVLLPLSAGEFDLLAAFAEHPQRVLSRDQLLDLTKGRAAGVFDRSIDVQLSRLRRKIEDDPNDPVLIKTVRGGGYLFAPTVIRQT